MQNSIQIHTAPLIRNFATLLDDASIQVTTKLGTETLVRAEFKCTTFPSDTNQQLNFLKEQVDRANPGAIDLLRGVAGRCLEDQLDAVRQLIAGSGTHLNG
ncbi:hypothetical protein ACSVIJ_04165 [Pseudomonas sp. NCHU5208]|uniref:hypothetical protein n=1 Tax=unclassified Pseudomonas TaxID=196821 RepID=UPI003F9A4265